MAVSRVLHVAAMLSPMAWSTANVLFKTLASSVVSPLMAQIASLAVRSSFCTAMN